MRHRSPAESGEETDEVRLHAPDHSRVELEFRERPAAVAHAAAAPAEGDAAVARRTQVVQHGLAIADRLATRPAECLEHVRNRLAEDDVARGHGERQAVTRKSGSRGVDREHRRPGSDPATGRCVGDAVPAETIHTCVLVNTDAPLEKRPPQTE